MWTSVRPWCAAAAAVVRALPVHLMLPGPTPGDIPHLGESTCKILKQILETGTFDALEDHRTGAAGGGVLRHTSDGKLRYGVGLTGTTTAAAAASSPLLLGEAGGESGGGGGRGGRGGRGGGGESRSKGSGAGVKIEVKIEREDDDMDEDEGEDWGTDGSGRSVDGGGGGGCGGEGGDELAGPTGRAGIAAPGGGALSVGQAGGALSLPHNLDGGIWGDFQKGTLDEAASQRRLQKLPYLGRGLHSCTSQPNLSRLFNPLTDLQVTPHSVSRKECVSLSRELQSLTSVSPSGSGAIWPCSSSTSNRPSPPWQGGY